MDKIKILLADDHSIVRMGISALLAYEKDISVVGEAEDGEEAVALAQSLKPDVVLMDLMMPRMDGVEATDRIRSALPSCKVLILTTFGTSADVSRAIASGASGAVVKDIDKDAIVDAIRRVAAGEKVFSAEIEQTVKEEPAVPNFTKRQMDILHSVTRGLTNAEIAKQYGISTDGVKQHVMAIFKKLGAANRSEAVAIAIRRQMLKI
jgi:DNA-binding NarL/FixJ family response regulator